MDYSTISMEVKIPVLSDGTVAIAPGLFYSTVGTGFDLLDKYMEISGDLPLSRLRVNLGRPVFDPCIQGFWSTRIDIINHEIARPYVTWLGRQAFCRDEQEEDIWVIAPQQGLLYQLPVLILFPSGIGLGYTQGVDVTPNGPIRYGKTLGDLALKMQFAKKYREPGVPPSTPVS